MTCHSRLFEFDTCISHQLNLVALNDRVASISGSSAGALVAGMLATGMPVTEMVDHASGFCRGDFWDFPGFGGL